MSGRPERIISLCTNSYGSYGSAVAIERLAEAGLKWVELPLRTRGFITRAQDPPLLSTGADAAEIGGVERLLQRTGVGISSCNILSGNPLDPQVLEITRDKLQLAQRLGVTLCVGDAGHAPTAADLPVLYDRLRRIGDMAADCGIIYCCETHPGLFQHPEVMLETLQSVDHPHIRINVDTANLLFHNVGVDIATSLPKILPFTRSLHLKDTPGGYQEYNFPALGDGGAIDFRQIRELAEAADFTGPYCIEIQGRRDEPEPSLEEVHRRVVASIETLRCCGYFDA